MMEYFNAYAVALFVVVIAQYVCNGNISLAVLCQHFTLHNQIPMKQIFFFCLLASKVISAPNKTIKFHFPKSGLLNVGCACVSSIYLSMRVYVMMVCHVRAYVYTTVYINEK